MLSHLLLKILTVNIFGFGFILRKSSAVPNVEPQEKRKKSPLPLISTKGKKKEFCPPVWTFHKICFQQKGERNKEFSNENGFFFCLWLPEKVLHLIIFLNLQYQKSNYLGLRIISLKKKETYCVIGFFAAPQKRSHRVCALMWKSSQPRGRFRRSSPQSWRKRHCEGRCPDCISWQFA